MIIAVDFDGTLAEHKYPKIGKQVPGAIETCLQLQECGHKLILLTMRSDDELEEAVEWCRNRGLSGWFGVNENPEQDEWTNSRKVYANHYIDDAAVGCPLVETDDRPYVDWSKVKAWLTKRGFFRMVSIQPIRTAGGAN